MGKQVDRREIEALTERLLAERERADQAAQRQEEEERVTEALMEDAEASEFAAELARIAELAPRFVRERRAEAELVTVPTTRRTGRLRKRLESWPEELPAWEFADGTGIKIATDKEGSHKIKRAYRFMLAADGRLLFGSVKIPLARPPHLPTDYHAVSATEPPRDEMKACGLQSAKHVAERVESLDGDRYESLVTWAAASQRAEEFGFDG